ncbi:MAG: chemotaxis protein CheB [Bacteroidales bacterium]|nr:chemotaxis protein CheB [Bacteroidales bacterium]
MFVGEEKGYQAVVIGSSAGGLHALKTIFESLDGKFPLPVIVVQHMSPDADDYLATFLNSMKKIRVKEADEKEIPKAGVAYIAPPNYHLLMEHDGSFTLTIGERVNYARPSVDVLFETAAEFYGEDLIGIILTGANNDGSLGLKKIKEHGGLTIVQDPNEAESDTMPRTALEMAKPDHVLTLKEIANFLNSLI